MDAIVKRKRLTLRDFKKNENISKSIDIKNNSRCWQPCNIYVYGFNTGTGKSYHGCILFENVSKYYHSGGKWFPNYDKHEAVIFNEINGRCFTWDELLNILGNERYLARYKGGRVNYTPMYQ